MAKEYLSIPEAGIVLGISRIAVFKQVKSGRLPAIRIGRNWAVSAAALQAKNQPAAKSARREAEAPADSPPSQKRSGGDRGFEDMGWD